jgi:hypothetical protein
MENKRVTAGAGFLDTEFVAILGREVIGKPLIVVVQPLQVIALHQLEVIKFFAGVLENDFRRTEAGEFEFLGLGEGELAGLGQCAVHGVDYPEMCSLAENLQVAINAQGQGSGQSSAIIQGTLNIFVPAVGQGVIFWGGGNGAGCHKEQQRTEPGDNSQQIHIGGYRLGLLDNWRMTVLIITRSLQDVRRKNTFFFFSEQSP